MIFPLCDFLSLFSFIPSLPEPQGAEGVQLGPGEFLGSAQVTFTCVMWCLARGKQIHYLRYQPLNHKHNSQCCIMPNMYSNVTNWQFDKTCRALFSYWCKAGQSVDPGVYVILCSASVSSPLAQSCYFHEPGCATLGGALQQRVGQYRCAVPVQLWCHLCEFNVNKTFLTSCKPLIGGPSSKCYQSII